MLVNVELDISGVWRIKTSRLQTLLVLFFHNSIAKTMLAKLAFLYYREFVKKSIDMVPFDMPSPYILQGFTEYVTDMPSYGRKLSYLASEID